VQGGAPSLRQFGHERPRGLPESDPGQADAPDRHRWCVLDGRLRRQTRWTRSRALAEQYDALVHWSMTATPPASSAPPAAARHEHHGVIDRRSTLTTGYPRQGAWAAASGGFTPRARRNRSSTLLQAALPALPLFQHPRPPRMVAASMAVDRHARPGRRRPPASQATGREHRLFPACHDRGRVRHSSPAITRSSPVMLYDAPQGCRHWPMQAPRSEGIYVIALQLSRRAQRPGPHPHADQCRTHTR
jgi:hypothetical protein